MRRHRNFRDRPLATIRPAARRSSSIAALRLCGASIDEVQDRRPAARRRSRCADWRRNRAPSPSASDSAAQAAAGHSCPAGRRPIRRAADDEGTVQVDLEAVGDRIVVDARGQTAGADQRCRRRSRCARRARAARRGVLRECLPRPPQTIDAELVRARRSSPRLSAPMHRRGDAGGVPVHAHHRARAPGTRTDRSAA